MPVTTFKTVAGRVLAQNKGGVYTRLVHDPLGNVIATCDAAGVVSNNTTYWPYGEVRTGGVSSVTPFGFCGAWGYYTDATGRLYVRARYYRPSLTRWQTVDPLWPDESAYGYGVDNPLDAADPEGTAKLKKCKECDADKNPLVCWSMCNVIRDHPNNGQNLWMAECGACCDEIFRLPKANLACRNKCNLGVGVSPPCKCADKNCAKKVIGALSAIKFSSPCALKGAGS